MTVLIGLRCQNGAVLACDSQETRVNSFRFWPKVNFVENRFAVLYAGSPTAGEAFTRRLVSAFHEMSVANAVPLDKPKAVHLVDNVLLELAREGNGSAVKDRQLLVAGVVMVARYVCGLSMPGKSTREKCERGNATALG